MLTGFIEQISPEFVHGWAAETEQPDAVIDVAIYLDGKRIAEVSCTQLRKDLRDLGIYGQGLHGFHYIFPAPLPQYGGSRVTVRFAQTGDILPNGEKVLSRWEPLRAVLITAPGRSGTTLLMSRLSRSPQICIADMHPHEVRQIAYWATVVRTLTGAADFDRSMHPDQLEGDGFKVGSNPFSDSGYTDLFRTKDLQNEYFGNFVPDHLRDAARIIIQEYYLRIRRDQQKPRSELFAEKNNNLDRQTRVFARTLFPDLKEIVLVRDPRDLLCSHLSYFQRGADQAIHEITWACAQLLRIKREEAERVLFLRYEDVVLDATATWTQISDYLDIAVLDDSQDQREQSIFAVHATSRSPAESIGRWRNQLSKEQRSWCSTYCAELLEQFGYEGQI